MSGAGKRGELWIVGTPIGNLDDLSPRARRALSEADALFCEDTRVTAKLAARFGLAAPRISSPAPREAARVGELAARLERGENVAIVTDAGMPGISDPGMTLVRAAAASGHRVRVFPGPSAPAAALAVSGLPAAPHVFVGFLPARAGERRRLFERLRDREETLVWFEAPHRLRESLEDAVVGLGLRRACVARELTKLHEETLWGTLPELAALFRARGETRGEITVVVEGGSPTAQVLTDDALDRRIAEALRAGRDKRAVARELARETGRPSREIYARAVSIGTKRNRSDRGGRGEDREV